MVSDLIGNGTTFWTLWYPFPQAYVRGTLGKSGGFSFFICICSIDGAGQKQGLRMEPATEGDIMLFEYGYKEWDRQAGNSA